MPAIATDRLVIKTEGICLLIEDAMRRPSAASFEGLEQQVGRLEIEVREMQQALVADDARRALTALKSGKDLTPDQRAVLRALVVGDAESYLHMENNLNEWLTELQRLAGEMHRLAGATSARALGELRGVVRDAVRLLPSIRAYMDEKCRLDRFDSALDNLDDANRQLLVHVVNEMLGSPTR